jgi:hypothetical protein
MRILITHTAHTSVFVEVDDGSRTATGSGAVVNRALHEALTHLVSGHTSSLSRFEERWQEAAGYSELASVDVDGVLHTAEVRHFTWTWPNHITATQSEALRK